jgi:hypothetical protein
VKGVLRELPYGIGLIAISLGITGFLHWRNLGLIPSSTPPVPGETLTGDAAANLHPKVAPAPLDTSKFTKLPPECGCDLANGHVQLAMAVTGRNQSITTSGSAVYVVHDVAVVRQRDAGEHYAAFPPIDGVAPGRKTQGFLARFDLACSEDRLVVVDAVHATLWDLAKDRPRRIWSTPLPARRGEPAAGDTLEIQCHRAKLDGEVVVVEPDLRFSLADGSRR